MNKKEKNEFIDVLNNMLDENTIQDLRNKIQIEIDDAFNHAINSPDPSEHSLMQHVYAE